jgi:putative restriction endonuclease
MALPAVVEVSRPCCGKVWYDDQRKVNRQIFDGDDTIDYAFMGQDPKAADNRWLREAFGNQIPIIYFLGFAPGRYQAILPTFISGLGRRGIESASRVRRAGSADPKTT